MMLHEKIIYPNTNSYLKAILVYYEKKKLDNYIYDYFDEILKSNNANVIYELAFLSYKLYTKNPNYFFNIFKKMIKLNDDNINWVICNRLSYDNKFSKNDFFELVYMMKDFDLKFIDNILLALKKYPREHKKIVDLFIYWLNKYDKFEFDSKNFRWVLEELVKQNKYYIREFNNRYKEIKSDTKMYDFIYPHLFSILSRYYPEYSLIQIFKIKLNNNDNIYLFYKLCDKLIGNIFNNSTFIDVLLSLNNKLINLIKNNVFISFNKVKYDEKIDLIDKNNLNLGDYNYFVNIAKDLLYQLRNRKTKYNFSLIRKNISKYDKVYEFTSNFIDKLESNPKKYSPIIWLGETENPNLDDFKFNENDSEITKSLKIKFTRDQFWARAYLKMLNMVFKKFENLKNENDSNYIKKIGTKFSDEYSFWSYESELVFINQFSNDVIVSLEPKVPNRDDGYLDLKVKLFKKNIYFEVYRPELNRKLNFSNGAVTLGNVAFNAINRKFKQLMADITLEEMMTEKRSDLFFVVVDRSSNPMIDEFQVMDAFFGSYAVNLIKDKNENVVNVVNSRLDDSIHNKNSNTDIISGVILFKQILMFDKNNEPFIKLDGNIILNPHAVNTLDSNELSELKKIIFK